MGGLWANWISYGQIGLLGSPNECEDKHLCQRSHEDSTELQQRDEMDRHRTASQLLHQTNAVFWIPPELELELELELVTF